MRDEPRKINDKNHGPALRVLPASIDEALKLRDCARVLMDYPNRKSFELGYWMDRWLDRYMVPMDRSKEQMHDRDPL